MYLHILYVYIHNINTIYYMYVFIAHPVTYYACLGTFIEECATLRYSWKQSKGGGERHSRPETWGGVTRRGLALQAPLWYSTWCRLLWWPRRLQPRQPPIALPGHLSWSVSMMRSIVECDTAKLPGLSRSSSSRSRSSWSRSSWCTES